MSRLPLSLTIVSLLLACSACQERFVSGEQDTELVLEGDFGVRILNTHGSVTLRAVEGDRARVKATIQALDEYRLETARILLEIEEPGLLEVRIDWPDGGKVSGERSDILVEMPRPRFAEIVTRDGRVGVADVLGELKIENSNGRIRLDRIGGDIEVDTSNAAIEVHDAGGDLELETSNGEILVQGLRGGADLETSNGKITLFAHEDGQGEYRLKTSNGKIHVKASGNFGGRVAMKTSSHVNCKIETPSLTRVSNRELEHRFDDGEARNRFVTSNGAILLELP